MIAAAGSGKLYICLDGIRGSGIFDGTVLRTGPGKAGLAVGAADAGGHGLNRVAVGFIFLDGVIRIGKDRSIQWCLCYLYKFASADFPVNEITGGIGRLLPGELQCIVRIGKSTELRLSGPGVEGFGYGLTFAYFSVFYSGNGIGEFPSAGSRTVDPGSHSSLDGGKLFVGAGAGFPVDKIVVCPGCFRPVKLDIA